MLKKSVMFALALVAVSSTAWAQTTKLQVTGLFGYTASDGVSGDKTVGGDGNVYDRIDPKNGGNFGFSVGFMVSENAEIGFMYRRQVSKLNISGPNANKDIGDLNIDGYHGYFAYYFGDPEAKVNPYFLGGFGATRAGAVPYVTPLADGKTSAGTEFSSTWGAGLRFNAAKHFALKAGVSWTPTYIKSDAVGWWCDPFWGCYVVGDAQYANQLQLGGGITLRF